MGGVEHRQLDGGACLHVDRVSRRFGATQALREVSIDIRPGLLHALLGGNGSGKSTLIKILAGTEVGDGGRVQIGTDTVSASAITPQWSAAHGLRFVHQDLGLFDDMSVADNLVAGRGYPRRRFGALDRHELREQVVLALSRVCLDVDPAARVGDLRPAQRTMVAIARALREPAPSAQRTAPPHRIVVLDEPTAALPVAESRLLFTLLAAIRERGDAIVLVSHRLGEVADVADEATVLRDGRVAAHLRPGEISGTALHRLVNGDATTSAGPRPNLSAGTPSLTPRLVVKDLHTAAVRVEHLVVDPGEIVGLVGLSGSGAKELLATIVGVQPGRGSCVTKDGRTLSAEGVVDAVRNGIGYVPSERHELASFPDQSVAANVLVASLHQRRTPRGLNRARLDRDARAAIKRYGIKAGPDSAFGSLSGGNQQKVVVARWLERRSDLLLLDEPTQGVDVAARGDIWNLIHEAAQRGTSVLLASTDLDEVVDHCHSVLVMRDGTIARQADVQCVDDLAGLLYSN